MDNVYSEPLPQDNSQDNSQDFQYDANGIPYMNGNNPYISEEQVNSLKGYDRNSGSRGYSILCIGLALTFLICVFLYIYLTRNKNYPEKVSNHQKNFSTGFSTSMSCSHSALQSTSSTNKLNTHTDQFPPLPMSSTLKSTYNISSESLDKGFNNNAPFLDTSSSSMSKKAVEKAHIEHIENQKNYRYPNPLFSHSKPIPRVKDEDQNPNVQAEIIRNNIDDTVIDAFPESVNILTQEEIKLLKLRNKSLNRPKPEVPPFPRAFNKKSMTMEIPSNNNVKSKITITPFNYTEEQSNDAIVPQTEVAFNKSGTSVYYSGEE